ncbi:MAG: DEAD/DEAH box helicase [Aeriscardovia sp.]|nr:DEAD/DEAH box helicase [Aeriscardovia sp.]
MDFTQAIEKRTKEYEDTYSLPERNAEGKAFEDLCAFYLKNGPWGKSEGVAVWPWSNPANPIRLEASSKEDRLPQDTGCDLVAEDSEGNYYVIQCKYYPNSTLTLDEAHLANIAALAQRYHIPQNHVIFCYVAQSVSPQAQNILSHYTCIREDELDNPDFDWGPMFGEKKRASKELRDYQKEAIEACVEGFKAEEYEGKRQIGKLIMACGTGKTFTSLSLSRRLSQGKPYKVLFLAPSIALVSQTFQAWSLEEEISPLIVCSDQTAGTGKGLDDEIDETISDIASPDVTTNSDEMVQKWRKIEGKNNPLRVVFSTYQSIEAVKEFQEKTGVKFDLTICDEAHRTASHEGSLFSLAAEPNYIDTVKKLFMTATPKIYSDAVQDKAKDEYATVLYSMDDEDKYGPEFYRFGFGEAVDKEVLCDYRVLILAMRKGAEELEDIQNLVKGTEAAKTQIEKLQKELNRTRSERTRLQAKKDMLKFEKHLSTLAGKIQGAYIDLSDLKASNQGEVYEDFEGRVSFREAGDENSSEDLKDKRFAHSAIGFANSIRNSKIITQALSSDAFPGKYPKIKCRHIDGEMKSDARLSDLLWLKQGQKNNEIRLITNAQCLSEGVDVPSLDAVVFFEKRQSQIGIIQAIGRVMRKADKKKYGYIIIPIMLSEGETPEDMLEDSDEYGAIWQILQSMRSVDERLDAQINTLALSKKAEKGNKSKKKKKGEEVDELQEKPQQRSLFSEDMQKKVVSYILSKCGSSMYWEDWVANISGSVKNMINEIDELADTPEIRPKFEEFKENLSKTLHKEQSKEDAVNLIAQFIVTRPVFSILFPASDFDSNPISRALESIAGDFKDAYSAYDRELGELKFSMEQAAKAVAKDPAARKRLVKNFYEKFYQKVFPKEADANGIVYTPEPVVDFMIKETDRLLEKNFGKRLQDEGIQILDPFSGTGTFVTRLLDKDLGVIDDEHIEEKYKKEIWANEIMPTAYYISTLNIEDAMRQRTDKAVSFPGAVLTDTFRISEAKDMLDSSLFSGNSDRENGEEDRKISVIISNPPYSKDQGNANENNAHGRYFTSNHDGVDDRIAFTYKKSVLSDVRDTHPLNDSYVRAFRWASDRIAQNGVIAFITNAGWLRSKSGAGIRRSFIDEFNDIYVYDLRGNARVHDLQEGENIFDIQTPVAITFLVQNPESIHRGHIHYISTPDFSTKEEKLELLEGAKEKEPDWENL